MNVASNGCHLQWTSPRCLEIHSGDESERNKSCTIWAGNLPYNYREEEVMTMFSPFGKVVKITIPMDKFTGKNKG